MGAVIGIKKSAWNNANATQKIILRWSMNQIDLGEGAPYKQGNTLWFVYSDWRITLDDVARLGTVSLRGSVSGYQPGVERSQGSYTDPQARIRQGFLFPAGA